MNQETLEQYLTAVLKLQQNPTEKKLSQDDLEKAAESLGVSEKDLKEIRQHFNNLLVTGSNYLRQKNLTKALEAFSEAHQINPLHLPTIMLIVDTHKQLFMSQHLTENKLQALEFCKKGLKLEPYNSYFARLDTLLTNYEQAYAAYSRYTIFAGVSGVAIAGGLGFLATKVALKAVGAALGLGGAVLLVLGYQFYTRRAAYQKAHALLANTTVGVQINVR